MRHFYSTLNIFSEALNIQDKIDLEIDNLLEKNFSMEAIESSKLILEEYLNQKKSNFVLAAILDKTKETSKIFKKGNQEPFSEFRKLIKFLLALHDNKLLPYLETNFLKKNSLPQFFIILEELVNSKKDTSFIEESFIKLIDIHGFSYVSINKFLKILSKDRTWLIYSLISYGLISSIIDYIHKTCLYEKDKLKEIAIAISSFEKYANIANYTTLVICMLQDSNEFIDILLQHPQISIHILDTAIIAEKRISAIKHYTEYLFQKDPHIFYLFESKLLESNDIISVTLLEYASAVSFSSKRMILKKLVQLGEEKELVLFIEKFPEYQNLLPML